MYKQLKSPGVLFCVNLYDSIIVTSRNCALHTNMLAIYGFWVK